MSDREQDRVGRAQVSPFPVWMVILIALAVSIYVGVQVAADLGVLSL